MRRWLGIAVGILVVLAILRWGGFLDPAPEPEPEPVEEGTQNVG